jgi:hypothetical protein
MVRYGFTSGPTSHHRSFETSAALRLIFDSHLFSVSAAAKYSCTFVSLYLGLKHFNFSPCSLCSIGDLYAFVWLLYKEFHFCWGFLTPHVLLSHVVVGTAVTLYNFSKR